MEGALKKKRQRDEPSEDLEDLKRVSVADSEYSGNGSSLPELSPASSPDSYYYCCVVDNDRRPWLSSDESRGCGIRGMAIRKQSYMPECLNDGINKGGEEDLAAGLDVGDVIKELWRAESPLCGGATEEPLFGDCHFRFEDHAASAFRFWEEDDDQKNETVRGKDLDEYEYDEELFAESVELEVCAPSL